MKDDLNDFSKFEDNLNFVYNMEAELIFLQSGRQAQFPNKMGDDLNCLQNGRLIQLFY
jgi:hypothetical protein